jgi:hypothetical protein
MKRDLRALLSVVSNGSHHCLLSLKYYFMVANMEIGYSNVVEDEERYFALDTVKDVLDRLDYDMVMLGGQDYPGILSKYYPDCKVQRSGCSRIKDTVDFANCLYLNRTTPIDWGPGPKPGEPRPIQNELPAC